MKVFDDAEIEQHYQQQQPEKRGASEVDMTGGDDDVHVDVLHNISTQPHLQHIVVHVMVDSKDLFIDA